MCASNYHQSLRPNKCVGEREREIEREACECHTVPVYPSTAAQAPILNLKLATLLLRGHVGASMMVARPRRSAGAHRGPGRRCQPLIPGALISSVPLRILALRRRLFASNVFPPTPYITFRNVAPSVPLLYHICRLAQRPGRRLFVSNVVLPTYSPTSP